MNDVIVYLRHVLPSLSLLLFAACSSAPSDGDTTRWGSATFERESPFTLRAFAPLGEPSGVTAIAYGPYGDGQRPGGPEPTDVQLAEDLALIASHWRLLRVYGATGPTERILGAIRERGSDLRVLLGIWIENDVPPVDAAADTAGWAERRRANRREVEAAVRLAAAYPEIVVGINVGNETQVHWSAHRVPTARVVALVREVRARTSVPITVADDFNYWNKPESAALAAEIDFIVLHAHPLWNGRLIDEALAWTREIHASVQAAHPTRPVVLGETGWATRTHDEGEQARLIRGTADERNQAIFYDAFTTWVRDAGIVGFFFEAFDERWKGGDHPDEVEKHWGLFRSDRTPKRALIDDT